MQTLKEKLSALKMQLLNCAILAEEIEIASITVPAVLPILNGISRAKKPKTANHRTIKPKKFYWQGEAADFLGVHTTTMANMCIKGMIPFTQETENSRRKLLGSDIIAFLEKEAVKV